MIPSQPELSPSTPAFTAEAAAQPPGTSRLRWGGTILTVVLLLAAFAGLLPRWRESRNLQTQTADLNVPSVLVVTAQTATAAVPVALPAEVRAWMEAPIYARAN